MGNYYAGMINNTGGYGELKHHGILGQKWGIRRFQNADGSLTEEGKKRYGVDKVNYNTNKFFRKITTGSVNGLPGLLYNPGVAMNDHREQRLKNKIESIKKNKKNYASNEEYEKELKNVERKYNYQKKRNIERELYKANEKQLKVLLGNGIGNILGSPAYKQAKEAGYSDKEALIRTAINLIPVANIAELLERHNEVTKKHGAKFTDWTWGIY